MKHLKLTISASLIIVALIINPIKSFAGTDHIGSGWVYPANTVPGDCTKYGINTETGHALINCKPSTNTCFVSGGGGIDVYWPTASQPPESPSDVKVEVVPMN